MKNRFSFSAQKVRKSAAKQMRRYFCCASRIRRIFAPVPPSLRWGCRNMSREYYLRDPALRRYFLSLPPKLQAAVATKAPELDLGELQLWAEQYGSLTL